MGGTKWGHVPNWMLDDPGFIGMGVEARYAMLMLWLTSSRHGNGHADERSLGRAMGTPDGFNVMAAMAEVEASGLIRVYPDPSGRAASDAGRLVYEICGYDDDAPNDQVKNRSENKLKRPPEVVGTTAELSGFVRTRLDGSAAVRTGPDKSGQVLKRLDGSAAVQICPDLSLEPEPEQEKRREEPEAPARVPIYERTPEPAPAQQDSPQRAFGASAHALNEGQQGQAQRQGEASLPAGAIRVVYENPAPRGMGGKVSARRDGTDRANEMFGGWPAQVSDDPEGDALAEQRRSRLNLERNARMLGFANAAHMLGACEEAAAQPSTYDPNAPEPTEDDLMAKMRVAQERERRHREELHRERMAELAEGDESDDEPIPPGDAASVRDSYLRALDEGALP